MTSISRIPSRSPAPDTPNSHLLGRENTMTSVHNVVLISVFVQPDGILTVERLIHLLIAVRIGQALLAIESCEWSVEAPSPVSITGFIS